MCMRIEAMNHTIAELRDPSSNTKAIVKHPFSSQEEINNQKLTMGSAMKPYCACSGDG